MARFEPNRWMLWSKPDSTRCWDLRPLDGGRTRLVSRIRVSYQWRSPMVIASLFLMEIGDLFMNRRELLGIKRRAEAEAAHAGSLDAGTPRDTGSGTHLQPAA